MLGLDTNETRRNPSVTTEVSSQAIRPVLHGLTGVKYYQTTSLISALEETYIKMWVRLANSGY